MLISERVIEHAHQDAAVRSLNVRSNSGRVTWYLWIPKVGDQIDLGKADGTQAA